MKKNSIIISNTYRITHTMKYSILPIILVSLITLSSCSKTLVQSSKHFTTYQTQWGNITIKDTLIATVEGDKSSDLAFRAAGIISEISVEPGALVKKWQILAVLGNREASIQIGAFNDIEWKLQNLSDTTLDIKWGTRDIALATEKLYDERIKSVDTQVKSLINTLRQAEQSLSNQTWSIETTLRTYATDVDRISTSMLYEWDRILGITTNFEYANDGWEPYLGTRIGNSKSEAENAWNALYSLRGKIRNYTQKDSVITDTDTAINDITEAYVATRTMLSSMNTMLQNSVVWGGLAQEKLDGWIAQWAWLGADSQQSESWYITYKNSIQWLIDTGTSWDTVAAKNLTNIELELESLKQSRETLIAEKQAKLKEIETNIYTIDSKKWEVSLQIAQTRMSAALASESTEYNIIRAPYDGVILNKYAEVGMVAWAWVPILRITSNKSKLAKVYIDNSIYGYSVDSLLSITLERDTDTTYTGTITLLQREKDPLYNKNYTEISIEWDVTIGEKIQVLLERKTGTTENGILIPMNSIITRYGPPGVYVFDGDTARLQLIDILASDMGYAEVNWLIEWQVIIVDGKDNIYDGEVVSREKKE